MSVQLSSGQGNVRTGQDKNRYGLVKSGQGTVSSNQDRLRCGQVRSSQIR